MVLQSDSEKHDYLTNGWRDVLDAKTNREGIERRACGRRLMSRARWANGSLRKAEESARQ